MTSDLLLGSKLNSFGSFNLARRLDSVEPMGRKGGVTPPHKTARRGRLYGNGQLANVETGENPGCPWALGFSFLGVL